VGARLESIARRRGLMHHRHVVCFEGGPTYWYQGQPTTLLPSDTVVNVEYVEGVEAQGLIGAGESGSYNPGAGMAMLRTDNYMGRQVTATVDDMRTVLRRHLLAAETDEDRDALQVALDELPEALGETERSVPVRQGSENTCSDAAGRPQQPPTQELERPTTTDATDDPEEPEGELARFRKRYPHSEGYETWSLEEAFTPDEGGPSGPTSETE
jgi:hypothetical protein